MGNMRKYRYVCDKPFAFERDGYIHYIYNGDVVTIGDKYVYTNNGYIIEIPDEVREKHFKIVFTQEESMYWRSLFHQAAISAMQGFITNGIVDKGNAEDSRKFLAETSAKTAHELINELMKEDYGYST